MVVVNKHVIKTHFQTKIKFIIIIITNKKCMLERRDATLCDLGGGVVTWFM